jgi:hypothetical protein
MVSHINPSLGSFIKADGTGDGEALRKLKTQLTGRFDTLVTKLNASGQSVSGDERKNLCWENFLSHNGKTKDTPLFYLFLLWDGEEVRWLSRKLDADEGIVSGVDCTSILPPRKRQKEDSFSDVFKTTIKEIMPFFSPPPSVASSEPNSEKMNDYLLG